MQGVRRLLGAVTTLCLTVSVIAGCSSGSKSADTAPNLSDKPVALTVYTWFGQRREALDEVIDAYTQKHPNTKIKVKDIQSGQVFTEDGKPNTAALEDGDLILLPSSLARMWSGEGKLRDLSNVRLPKLNEAIAPFYDDLGTVDGKRMSLPYSVTPTVLLLNPKRFETAGVKLPPVDWTIQDWDETQAALKAAGIPPTMHLSFFLDPMIRAFGGQMYDSARQAWAFDTPEAKQGLAWLQRQVKDQVLTPDRGKTELVIGGREAPAFTPLPGGISLMPGMQFQPLPKGPEGRSVPVTAMVGAVLASSAHPEQATDFLKEMISNPEAQMALAKGGIRPVTDDSKAMAAWQESVGDRTSQAVELSLPGAYVASPVTMQEVLNGLSPYFQGKASLDEIVPGLIAQLKQ